MYEKNRERQKLKDEITNFIGFFDYENVNMEFFEENEVAKEQELNLKNCDKYIVKSICKLSVSTALQLYAFIVQKPYFRRITLQRIKQSLRYLVKSGILSYLDINSEFKQRIYFLGKKGITFSETNLLFRDCLRNKALYELFKTKGAGYIDILSEQMVINQFLAAAFSTTNVSNADTMIDLEQYDLQLKNISTGKNYLPAKLTVLASVNSVAPTYNKFFNYNKKIAIFPFSTRRKVNHGTDTYLAKEFCLVNEYVRCCNIKSSIIVVLVPDHKVAYELHEKLSSLNDPHMVSHFYLLENDIFYMPFNNLFSFSEGKIKQYSLFT